MPETVFAAFCAAGLWPGVGPAVAAQLAETGINGPEDVTVERLRALPRVGPAQAERLLSAWIGSAASYEVAEMLVPAGLPARVVGRVVDALGDGAARLLREDPWRLLELPDVQLVEADRVAVRSLPGVRRDDARRGRALVVRALVRAARDGHTAYPADLVAAAVAAEGVADPAAAVAAAGETGAVLEVDAPEPHAPSPDASGPEEAPNPGAESPGVESPGAESLEAAGGDAPGGAAGPAAAVPLLALDRYAMAEDGVAEGIARLTATAKPVAALAADAPGGPAGDELDPAQQAAVRAALGHGVSVLTGGPGTGKSRTVAAVVRLAESHGKSVALAAPTGRAAKRLEELTGAPASTIHRLLGAWRNRSGADAAGAEPGRHGGGRRAAIGFAHGEGCPLEADVVVIDEASMLDAELAAALVEACADGTHLLLVGDPAQLPSIGAGRVLGDIVDSGAVPVTELTTLYRQAEGGAIARLATSVRAGELPAVRDPDREVVVVPARGSAEAAHRVAQLVTDSIPRALGIPAGQVQVVTPVHRGPAGTVELNRALKARLNPGAGVVSGFDPGDRVVATANHLDAEPAGFANGEVGVVTAAGGGTVTVDFASGPAQVSGKALADIRHGWAVTVHRAQGSEWPAVVVALPPEASGMLSRPLVYTALTRAQRHVSVVHAAGPAVARAVREVGARPRRTRLRALLTEAMAGI